ncbi:MAG TPA: type IV toxin-antitoxin system AbiEi family antitoxin domain-containing protein [Solirubrobacteraceae bacterium]|nr:type IV toxin-antitoxin system AbiEi family antitoxin domain-containing protein [Solirubrobacteraceae bacterium]
MSALGVCSGLADGQKGVVTRWQLLAAGLSPRVITRFIRQGFLHPLHRGVYAVGHLALPPFAREQAALLACGEGAVLSGRSALYVWGIIAHPSGPVEVTVAARRRRPHEGVLLHVVKTLDERDVRTRHSLPVVFPARALIEYAATATADELGDAVADARQARLLREGELEAAVNAAAGRPGAPAMRAWLRDEAGPAITRSRAERRFRKLLQEAQLPEPLVNRKVAGVTPDFLWPTEKLVLEVDGWDSHRHRHAFEWDRKKDRILGDAGYLVIRVTWRHFTEETLALIAHIARMLDRRRVA